MDSRRFPGKVLADLAGYPILEHVVTRCRVAGLPVVVATTDRRADDPIANWAITETEPVDVFRWDGPVDDVLGRYVACAGEYEADAIIRMTGDSPLVPTEVIEVVAGGLQDGALLACHTYKLGTVPDGWEVEGCTVGSLEVTNHEASTYYEREHVFPYVYRFHRPGKHKATRWNAPWLVRQKFSVDTPEDLKWLRSLAQHLDFTPPNPIAADLVGLLEQHPELRRSLMEKKT